MQATISSGALIVPTIAHGANGTPKLLLRVLREWMTCFALNHLSKTCGNILPIISLQIGIERKRIFKFIIVNNIFKIIVADAHHHIAIHLLKTPIAVPGKARIAGFFGQCSHGDIIETKVEDRIHHARHRGTRTGAHRDQKRIFLVTEHKSHIVRQSLHCRIDFGSQPVRKSPLIRIVESANVAGHGKTRGYAQAYAAHFSQIGSLAT